MGDKSDMTILLKKYDRFFFPKRIYSIEV